MNRDFENNNRSRKNHYADFDEHGNARTGNPNSLSRHNPDDHYRGGDAAGRNQHYGEHNRGRISNDARAYGDYSRGTRYGEGGSTFGGGSSYGNSYYGMSGNQGPRNRDYDRNQSGDVQRGYGDYNDYHARGYDHSGSTNYRGAMNQGRGTNYRGAGYDERFNPDYGSTGRESTGYDRGFRNYGNTGYGSTGYDNRDQDRERSAYSNRNEYDRRSNNRGYDENRNNRDENW